MTPELSRKHAGVRWFAMFGALVALTAIGRAMAVNPATMALLYLFGVVFLSMWAGLRIGLAASLLATAGYNYYFLPPLYTFHIDDPRNWAALTSFLAGALVVTRILVAAREQAAEAERRRMKGEASAHIDLLRQSDAFKTSLLRAVSHDLTTPLTAIRIHTAALERQSAASPQLAETVRAVAEETARLHRRIENLLTIARLESGRFTPHPEPTPPVDIFRLVREALPSAFSTRPVAVSIDDSCPDVLVDPSLALEILVNLVDNAHRASPADAPMELAATHGSGRVLLEVRDRGPGIATDADVARHGLGLEIARGLTTASSGMLTLENREGGGTIARVDLPAAVLEPVELE